MKNGSSLLISSCREHNSPSVISNKWPRIVLIDIYIASDYYKKFKEPEFDENGKLKYLPYNIELTLPTIEKRRRKTFLWIYLREY